MEDIYNQLNIYLRGSSRTGINETVAEFMLTCLYDIPHLRAADVADRCHTSAASVVRFCRELGYGGYPDFKDAVDAYIQNVEDKFLVPRAPMDVFGSEEAFAASMERWTRLMQQHALRTLLAVDRPRMIELAKDIVSYPKVYVFGIGMAGIVAEQLRIRLARGGKIIIAMPAAHTDIPLTDNRADTLGIVISQHARMLSATHSGDGLLPYLKQSCAKTWLITQEPETRKFPVDETLYILATENHEAEYHSLLYFEEVLGESCCQLLEKNGIQ